MAHARTHAQTQALNYKISIVQLSLRNEWVVNLNCVAHVCSTQAQSVRSAGNVLKINLSFGA